MSKDITNRILDLVDELIRTRLDRDKALARIETLQAQLAISTSVVEEYMRERKAANAKKERP